MDNKKMAPIGELLKKTFDIYLANTWSYVSLMSLMLIVFLVTIPVFGGVALGLVYEKPVISWTLLPLLLLCVLLAVLVSFWVQTSLLFLIKDRQQNPTLGQSLKKGWNALLSMSWIYLLVGLASMGGFILLIIPGVIFTVWFWFARYVFINEDIKGVSAMSYSKKLVEGYFWPLLGRLALLIIMSALISSIQFLGNIINIFFTIPFISIAGYLLYEDLKRIKGM